jgi:predicted nucleotidyltransferase component of viral defense system
MKTSKQELLQEAAITQFRPEILEKVWYLMALLDAINEHSFLKDRLALKGGTALNLFFFDLPRLSVDIDLNYIGQIEREAMLLERPLVEQAVEAIFRSEGLAIRRMPEKHAGGKWQLKYESALGGYGNLEVDLNFMFRLPLYDIKRKRSHFVGTHQTQEVAILDIHELGAGKLSALFHRHASRDLFDAHELLTNASINFKELRLSSLLYGIMGSRDWRDISIDEIHFEKKELQNQLIPILRKDIPSNHSDWTSWTNQLVHGCRNALSQLFPLKDNEREFLDKLHDHGKLDAALIISDVHMLRKIEAHPLIKWKMQLIEKNNPTLR